MSRFAWSSRAVVALMIGLVVWGIAAGAPETSGRRHGPADADLRLYAAIGQQMGQGTGYYAAVAEHQSRLGYPTRPVMTVREPTLAWVVDTVGGPDAARVLLLGLAIVTSVVMVVRLRSVMSSFASWAAAGTLSTLSLLLMAWTDLVLLHEVWAGVLIAWSIALRTRRRWLASVVAGLAAALIRELAVPYLLVMLFLAWRDHRRREAVAWGLAIVAWAIFYGVHIWRVLDLVPAGGSASPGWLAAEGWPLFVEMIRSRSMLVLLPFWVSAAVVPLALLGWWTCKSAYAVRVALTLTVYAVAFMVVGRADTTYWGFLLAALVLPGIAMVPRVLGPMVESRDPENRPAGDAARTTANSRLEVVPTDSE